jgi:uncharacterized protein YegP (UPF0339 family)
VTGARDRAEIFQGADGQWYFRILAGNGETIASSEGHKRKIDAWAVVENHYPGIPIQELEDIAE